MNDRTARLALLLALAPLLAGLFYVGGAVVAGFRSSDDVRGASFVATLTLCLGTVWIWRRYVRWDLVRVSSTAGLTLLALGQVLLWYPVFPVSDCVSDDLLRCGQSSTLAGLWCVGCALTWWWSVLAERRRPVPSAAPSGGLIMSPNTARAALGMALLPLLPGVFFLVAVPLEDLTPLTAPHSLFVAYEACALVAVGAWLRIWRRRVAWTPLARRRTSWLAIALAVAPMSVYVPDADTWLLSPAISTIADAVRDTLPLFALAAWFGGTALAWRTGRTSAEPSELAQVTCPQCSYSLVGLREVRCPECGWSSTVDDIVGRALANALD